MPQFDRDVLLRCTLQAADTTFGPSMITQESVRAMFRAQARHRPMPVDGTSRVHFIANLRLRTEGKLDRRAVFLTPP